MFRIMSEFVEGFDELARIGPAVSIFGSARFKKSNKYYKESGQGSEAPDQGRLYDNNRRRAGRHGGRQQGRL